MSKIVSNDDAVMVGDVALAAPTKARATTVRLTPAVQQGLELLQGVLKQPVNKMVNEAVEGFIERRTAEIEADLESLLAQVKAYRRSDPTFEAALAKVVDAEAGLGGDDPVEGAATDAAHAGRRSASATPGPSQALVRDLLSR